MEIAPIFMVECNILSDIAYQLSRMTRMEVTKYEMKLNSRPLDTENSIYDTPMSDLSHTLACLLPVIIDNTRWWLIIINSDR